MAKITIYKSSSRCFIRYGEYEPVTRYRLEASLAEFVKKNLTSYVYNFRMKHWDKNADYSIKDPINCIWYFPAPFLAKIRDWFLSGYHEINYVDIEPYPVRPVSFNMSSKFIAREDQLPAIDFLISNKGKRSGLELQTGCVGKDACVDIKYDTLTVRMTIAELYEAFGVGKTLDPTKHDVKIQHFNGCNIDWTTIEKVTHSGDKLVRLVQTKDDKSIYLTMDHQILTPYGFFPLEELGLCAEIVVKSEYVGEDQQILIDGLDNHPNNKDGKVDRLVLLYEANTNGYEYDEYIARIQAGTLNWKETDVIDPKLQVIAYNGNSWTTDIDNVTVMDKVSYEAYKLKLQQGKACRIDYSPIVKLGESLIKMCTYDIKCVGSTDTNNFMANNIIVHNSGKTFCSVKAAQALGEATMIVVDSRIEQWVDAIEEQTELTQKSGRLYVIQGNKSLKKLLDSDLKPDIILASLPTLRAYVKHGDVYQDCIPYGEFIKKYGIGTKIVDEAHLCFHANCILDMAGDIPTNIYLTATFITGDRMLQQIFHTCYPNQMRYDNGYEKYCNVIGITHRTNIPTKTTLLTNGYSHSKYEKVMLWNKDNLFKPFLARCLYPLIENHYVKETYPGKKILIYFSLKRTIRYVAKRVQKRFPKYNVVTYIDGDPASNLAEGDIIISTHKGAGTGTDIKGLITVINTTSFLAETTARQILGRLRKLKDYTPTYIDIHDVNNSVQIRHWRKRKHTLEKCAKLLQEFSV